MASQNVRDQEAYENLEKLHAKPSDPDGLMAKEELFQIWKQIKLEEKTDADMNFWKHFQKPSYRKRLLHGVFVQYVDVTPTSQYRRY
jgi:hypothetical protein